MAETFVGIDCGGTNLRVYVVNPTTGELVSTLIDMKNTEIPSNDVLTTKIHKAISELGSPKNVKIGAATAGDVDEEGLVVKKSSNFKTIREPLTFPKDLAGEGYEVTITNDMKAALMGAVAFGQGKGLDNVLIATYSSGYNCAVWANGNILERTIEFGHQPYKPGSGVFCGCGGEGHLEPFVSGNGAATIAQQALLIQGIPPHTVLEEVVTDPENSERTQERIERLKKDEKYRKKAFEKITAREVYDAFERKPHENPQKTIRNNQVQAIAHSFGKMISAYSPLDLLIAMGSQATKDWENLFQPAKKLYEEDRENYHLSSLKSPDIVMNTMKKIGAVGGVAYFLLRHHK